MNDLKNQKKNEPFEALFVLCICIIVLLKVNKKMVSFCFIKF